MTLLQSVNRVLRALKEDDISTISGSERDQEIVDALNRGAERVLRTRDWSFLKRYGVSAFYPGVFKATTGGNVTKLSLLSTLNVGGANAWDDATGVTPFSRSVRSKILWTNSSFPETSIVLLNLQTNATFGATMGEFWLSDSVGGNSASWEIYTHEYILPDTVRKVLAVYNHEGQDVLCHFERDVDPGVMLRASHYTATPNFAYVGGHINSTLRDAVATGRTSGTALTIWPPPSESIMLKYDYVHQHSSLTFDSAEWDGVPNEHISLIENVAFEMKLEDNKQADPQRAALVARNNRRRYEELARADDDQPNRSMSMRPYGTPKLRRGFWSRWEDDPVPSP